MSSNAYMQASCMPLIHNLLLLDSEGKRICVKYFGETMQTIAAQTAFEKTLFNKTSRVNARGEPEIIAFDNVIVVYKFIGDLHFYATADSEENEVILASILGALTETVSLLLTQVDKKSALENLDLIFMTLDELVDGGIILETDPGVVAGRVSMRGGDGGDIPLSEQTFSQALASAKEQLARSLLS